MTVRLDSAAVNLAALREASRSDLCSVLDSIRGKKTLVLDKQFAGPLGLVAEGSLLKEHGVDQLMKLEPELKTDSKHVLYLIRSNVDQIKLIVKHIKRDQSSGFRRDYSIFFVPRRTMICESVLAEEGCRDDVTIGEYQLDLIPFDDDVLSLELPLAYRQCFLEGDRTSLFYVARALMKMQALFGTIPVIKGKGEASKLIFDMMVRMRKEAEGDALAAAAARGVLAGASQAVASEIDCLILIDREVDMVTPMCTQLTYEGLIDELYGINNGIVKLAPEVLASEGSKEVQLPLSSNDVLFAEIRDQNFSAIGQSLNAVAKRIKEYYNKRHELEQSSLTQIKDFVGGLKQYRAEHQSLTNHTNLADAIKRSLQTDEFGRGIECEQSYLAGTSSSSSSKDDLAFIEELIARHEPLPRVLRLLILYSQTHAGLKAKQFDAVRRELIQTYGYEHLLTLDRLERLRLFRATTSRSNPWSSVRRSLRLIVDDVNEAVPDDMSYVFSGYAPLSCRLVEAAFRPGSWGTIDDTLKQLPGPTFKAQQELPAAVAEERAAQEAARHAAGATAAPSRREVVLVFFVGGVTFAEIAAIRFLNERDATRDYLIASTKLINGTGLLKTLF